MRESNSAIGAAVDLARPAGRSGRRAAEAIAFAERVLDYSRGRKATELGAHWARDGNRAGVVGSVTNIGEAIDATGAGELRLGLSMEARKGGGKIAAGTELSIEYETGWARLEFRDLRRRTLKAAPAGRVFQISFNVAETEDSTALVPTRRKAAAGAVDWLARHCAVLSKGWQLGVIDDELQHRTVGKGPPSGVARALVPGEPVDGEKCGIQDGKALLGDLLDEWPAACDLFKPPERGSGGKSRYEPYLAADEHGGGAKPHRALIRRYAVSIGEDHCAGSVSVGAEGCAEIRLTKGGEAVDLYTAIERRPASGQARAVAWTMAHWFADRVFGKPFKPQTWRQL